MANLLSTLTRPLCSAALGSLLVLGGGCGGHSGGDSGEQRDGAMPGGPQDASDRSDGPGLVQDSGSAGGDGAGQRGDASSTSDAGRQGDGGADGAVGAPDLATARDMAVPPDMATSPVTGTVIDTYVQDPVNATVPRDLTGASIAALVPNGMGGFATYPGTGLANGTFSIPGVPMGAYYLKLNKTYVATSSRSVDLSGATLGRPDAVAATVKPTPLVLHVNNMNPWQASDFLELFCAGVDSYIYGVNYYALPIPTGSTSLNDLTVDYASASFPPNLIDGAKGDIAYLTQLATMTSGGTTYLALRKIFQPGAFTQRDGVTSTLTGSFLDVAQGLSASFNWKRSLFAGYRAAVQPAATANGQSISVYAQPGGAARAGFSNSPDLLQLYEQTSTTDVLTGPLSYGDAFPAKWALVGTGSATFAMQYALPGTTALSVLGSIYYDEDVALFTASPVQPLISPPQDLQVNGKSAATALSGVTTAPLLTWSMPATGTADAYQVTVYHLTKSGTSTARTAVAYFYTKARSITLPPGVLQAGEPYYIAVRAIAQPGLDVATRPFANSVPTGGADVLSGILTP